MKVLLAHTQKPWNETRLFEKLGAALSDFKGIQLAFFGIENHNEEPNIADFKVFEFKESVSRIHKMTQFFGTLQSFQPEVVIAASPDLLIPSLIFKYAFGAKLIFDCQENFVLNFRHQTPYKGWKSKVLPGLTELFFNLISPLMDRIWLSDRIYAKQMAYFYPQKTRIFENRVPEKWLFNSHPLANPDKTKLLFSGYLTVEAGLDRVIKWNHFLQTHGIPLEIECMGFFPGKDYLKKLVPDEFEKLALTNTRWLSSFEIQNGLKSSHAILMPYLESPANIGKYPTKFFEALFEEKPIICQKGSWFAKIANEHSLGIEVDFDRPDLVDFQNLVLEILKKQKSQSDQKACVFDHKGLQIDFGAFYFFKNQI